MLIASFLAACVPAIGASTATAFLPVYQGGDFPTINSPSDPEEFSWEVELRQGQKLMQINEHEAAVYYEDGTMAWLIAATPARDAVGANVPTTIQVVGENVVTLTVHHREGNPAAGGAPFVYPIDEGESFEVGNSTVTILLPPGESLGGGAAQDESPRPNRSCSVPRLKGLTLKRSRERLRRAGCGVGKITRAHGVTAKGGKVVRQMPRPGGTDVAGFGVNLRLG